MKKRAILTLLGTMLVSTVASAHHSPFLFFDATQMVEIEGVVKRVVWRNPHAAFVVEAPGADGNMREWEAETNSISILRRMDLTKDTIQAGDRVRIAGWPGKQGGADVFVINMLIPDGREIVFMPGQPARWDTEIAGSTGPWLVTEADLAAPAGETSSIFKTWSTSLAEIQEILMFDGYPFQLTEMAEARRAEYDLYDNPIFEEGCAHKGMPTIMEQPYPMEIIDGGDVITIRMEEGDAVREIRMGVPVDVDTQPAIPMGYSWGEWDGDTLVVTTTRSSWPYLDMTGVPNSEEGVYVERFTPTEDGKRLDYEMTVTESALYVEPVVVDKYWFHIPGDEVKPYECESG